MDYIIYLFNKIKIFKIDDHILIFFILSIDRSGTKFLADLLNQSKDMLVLHDPFERII